MNVEIDVDELCSLRADLRALMEENEKLKEEVKAERRRADRCGLIVGTLGRCEKAEEENEKLRGQGKVTCGGRTALEWHNYCTAAQAVHNIELNELKEKNATLKRLMNARRKAVYDLATPWKVFQE